MQQNKTNHSVKELSIVIPCYNSETYIGKLIEELHKALESIEFEVVLVNDCSPDNLALEVKRITSKYDNVKYIEHSINYGQQRAILTGFRYVNAKYVATMDDDAQYPPSEIPKMLAEIKKTDSDAIFGKPEVKKNGKNMKSFGSILINKIIQFNYKLDKSFYSSPFRILTKEVTEKMLCLNPNFAFLTAMVLETTHRIKVISVKHVKRETGRSNYNLSRSIKLALDFVFNYTTLPLKVLSKVSMLLSALSFIGILIVLLRWAIASSTYPGWTSTILVICLFSGIILGSLSVIGEYIIRIQKNTTSPVKPFVRTEVNTQL